MTKSPLQEIWWWGVGMEPGRENESFLLKKLREHLTFCMLYIIAYQGAGFPKGCSERIKQFLWLMNHLQVFDFSLVLHAYLSYQKDEWARLFYCRGQTIFLFLIYGLTTDMHTLSSIFLFNNTMGYLLVWFRHCLVLRLGTFMCLYSKKQKTKHASV